MPYKPLSMHLQILAAIQQKSHIFGNIGTIEQHNYNMPRTHGVNSGIFL